jgi:hypothetical protein
MRFTTPVLHPTDEDLSAGAPVLHPTDEDLSAGGPGCGAIAEVADVAGR